MEDLAFRKKYQKYKLRVKMWEKDFRNKCGRIPSKYDIRDASQEIRDSYKMYYKLKTSFLEDTLNDVLAEDGFNVLEISQSEETAGVSETDLTVSINGGPQLPLDLTGIVSEGTSTATFSNVSGLATPNVFANVANLHENHAIKHFEAVNELKLNRSAWGSAVSNKVIAGAAGAEKKQLKFNLKPDLFKSSPFSMRNPRKSLSRINLDMPLRQKQTALINFSLERHEVLPDLETILTQKAKEQQTTTVIAANPLLAGNKSKKLVKACLDEGWLNRTATQNDMATARTVNRSVDVLTKKMANKQYGLSNIDVFSIKSNEQLEIREEHRKLNEANIQLTTDNCITTADTTSSPILNVRLAKSDSDSVVSDSEDECVPQDYRHIVKRRRTAVVMEASPKNGNATIVAINLNLKKNENYDISKKRKGTLETLNMVETTYMQSNVSVNDDKDKNYVTKKPKASSRKNTMAKRARAVEKKAAPTEIKSQAAQSKPKLAQNVKKGLKKTKPKGVADLISDGEIIAEEEEPPNTDQLKYDLALDRGDIVCVPRAKLCDLEFADDVAQRYINTTAAASLAQERTRDTFVDAKRVAARKKLEQKIATGKLNENFVTINIQKKKFTRGKNTVNYSKYKKKLWSHKKRVSALTGPDMNMGGCDGGVLLCFTCGQAGHFAQNCKVKGDSLLPLTAQLEEDPSPFPTLEEAERMASQNALAVHSRNIAKLPAASNVALYRNNELSGKETQEIEVSGYDEESESTNNETHMLMSTDDELEALDVDAAIAGTLEQNISPIKKYVGHKIPEEFLKRAGLDSKEVGVVQFGGVSALYNLKVDGSLKGVTPEVLEALHMFGHSSFRKGQDRAIMRILSGLSTLVTLSTGSGKSLCYQLPAYLYSRQKKCITLVISPLVSLMEDQVHGVPHFLRAYCLHTGQTPQQRLTILEKIRDGQIDILLVSPEAVVAGERSNGFGSILRQLPPIAFACIDEAHCVSQWSHNFRPSYLMICKVLKKNLGVHTVLGLTATATLPTRTSIINHLSIPDGENGVISDTPLPDNLILSVSKDANRDAALLQLLTSKRFDGCQSIIIYCTRRDECERIAGFLRTSMQDRKVNMPEDGKKKRKRVNWQAEPYHAGMPASRRRTIQNAFMRNELRIVVATIAFGMGINKPDIRAVIHYNMPRNFESYVQEIGRAGRDGNISHCHLFLDAQGGDQNELRRHIYANSIDRHVIRKLLQHVFVPCACDKNAMDSKSVNNIEEKTTDASDFGVEVTAKVDRDHICPGHEIGFSIEKAVEALDIPGENISTLLCYLELDTRWCISVLSSAYIMAKVISYGGPKYLKHAAKESPPLAMAVALEIKNNNFKEDSNIIEFSVVDIAAAIGWNSGVVKYQLKNLEWMQVNGFTKRSPITVNFDDLGFRLKAPGDFHVEEIDDALDTLYKRSVKQEHTQLIQLQYVFQGLSSVAYNTYVPCACENFSEVRSDQLKGIIRDYFRNDYPKDLKLEIEPDTEPDDFIINDVYALINMYPENNFSGRNVARIFHGISSPNYPAVMWGRCKYWRAHTKSNFNRIVQLANTVIVQSRM